MTNSQSHRSRPSLGSGAENAPPAIAAPERTALSYAALRRLIRETVRLKRIAATAPCLPNGLEVATVFISVASRRFHRAAQSVDELGFYLSAMGVKASLSAGTSRG